MNFHKISPLIVGDLLAASPLLFAGVSNFSERGQLLFSDDFSGPAMAQGWAGKPGKWEMVNGAVQVSQVREDDHAAVRRHPLPPDHDAIFEFSFEFDGAKGMALQVEPAQREKRVEERQAGHFDDAGGIGQRHKVVVEVHGPVMIAQLDDAPPITGENPRVDVDKTDHGIPFAGVSAKVKGLKVYSAEVGWHES